jgi:hypothetical protein
MKMTLGMIAASVGVLAFGLGGCGDASTETAKPSPPAATSTAGPDSPSPTPSESAPVSEIDASVMTFVGALDALGIEHSDPVRTEVGLSGAKARFDLTVNGYDAGINIFPNVETMSRWQEASDSLGGIHVAVGVAVLTLNSSDGVADSAEIAPRIAQEVGGEARGV